MLDLFQSKDAAESFIWADGRFRSVTLSEKKKEMAVSFTDYCGKRIRFLFSNVDEVKMTEPVYCVRASHARAGKRKILSLYDDDGLVLSFQYGAVASHEEEG